jgi:hypothetical protein
MSHRAVRWSLWAIFCLTLPLPYFMIESGRIPLVSLLVFAGLTAPLAFTDPGLTTRVIAGLFAGQTLLYGGVLYLAARLLAARIPARRRVPVVVVVGFALALVALRAVYVAPLSHGPGPTNWFGLWP